MDQKRKDPLSVLLNATLLAALAAGVYAYSNLSSLPPLSKIHPSMMNEPKQYLTREQDFTFTYKGADYGVEPIADYELWGLVVTHNDIMAFTDIYHDENSVDIKDICVIWGDNLTSNNYRLVEYYSEPWTCFFKANNRETFDKFESTALSNSHLLSDLSDIREKIFDTQIGDQIHLKGMLVNYFPENNPSWVRKSSIRRDDTGNGACEVIFVEDYEILKRGNKKWWDLYNACKWLIVILLGIKLSLFVKQVYFRPPL
jgi:hypothetical protein